MKLAGLTWWRNNYGSILQAYALQEELNSYDNVDYEIINQYGKKIASFDNLLDKLKNVGIKNTCQRIIWKFGFKKVRERNIHIQSFVDQKLRISKQIYNEDTIDKANRIYDGFVCGSDQIWNPTITKTNEMYWLGFAPKNKLKFSYAPSVGVNAFTQSQEMDIKLRLETFDGISCREEVGTNLLNHFCDNRCITVLDPTLLVDNQTWTSLYKEVKVDKPYIFVYLLRGSKSQRKLIELFAKNKGLIIVTIPFLESEHAVLYDFKFGDIKYWDCGPEDFISLIRGATYVFTDSFHSTIFSCINHKEFFIFPKSGKAQMNRLIDLQSMLGIENRIINNMIDIERVLSQKIDWHDVDNRILEKRKVSKQYLDRVLSSNKVV